MRLRLLPMTVMAAVLLLGVKLGELWTGSGWSALEAGIADVRAQDSEPTADDDEAEADDDAEAASDDEAEAGGETEATSDESLTAMALEAEQAEPLIEPAPELTQAELDVLQSLRSRREALDAREAELALRESMIAAAQHNLEGRLEEWRRLEARVSGLLERFESERSEELERLASFYEKMKPKDAARVFNELDMPYLIEIVGRMKDARVAEIIGKMDTIKAMGLTMELARRHDPGLLTQEAAVQ